nr:hypothetical protein [Tanacetum cinerariifolium]
FVKEDIEKDDVQFDSVVKDAEQIENETLPRQKFPSKAYLSPYIQPPSIEVKCKKRRHEIKLEKVEKKSSKLLLGRMELKLNCYHGKRMLLVPQLHQKELFVLDEVNALFCDKNRMEISWTFPWCADGHPDYIDFWEKLVVTSHTKRGWLSTS